MPCSALERLRPRPRGSDQRGAAAVEFALLAPLFFMVVLGMFSGGLAFSRKLGVTSAVREGVRYGATLPIDGAITPTCAGNGSSVPDCWFDLIRERSIASASGDLNETWDGQYVCVAYVGQYPKSSTVVTAKREKSGSGGASTTAGQMCFDDGRGTTERRVQVLGRRNTRFDVLLWGSNLSLASQAVARFEAVAPAS